MKACVFCEIRDGRLLASHVHADEHCIAFLDLHPVNPGHVLIVPRRHVERSFELTELEAGHLLATGQRIYRAIRTLDPRAEGANFFLSDGVVAGQEVPHAHLHVVPRSADDGHRLGFAPRGGGATPREELDRVAARLRDAL